MPQAYSRHLQYSYYEKALLHVKSECIKLITAFKIKGVSEQASKSVSSRKKSGVIFKNEY